jgi:uncharacterized protein YcnI
MKKLLSVVAVCSSTLYAGTASGHNYLRDIQAPAGHVSYISLRVPHGCKGSPINKIRIKIPDDVYRVTVDYRDDWDIELTMREVNPPAMGHGGRPTVTETVDTITWSNPTSILPADRTGEFSFRALLPNEPGRIVFFKALNDCIEGDDYYVDLPEEPLDLKDPDFHEKFWAFMTATANPAPYVILTEPERPQYPWEWKTDRDKPLPAKK